MTLSKQEKQLKLLKCQSLFDLALKIPKSYLNLSLIPSLTPTSGVLRIKTIQKQKTHQYLKITAIMLDFQTPLTLTIFHPKAYHHLLFKENQELFVYGELTKQWGWNMIQPQVVSEYGMIKPLFKQKGIKDLELQALIQSLLPPFLNQHFPASITQDLMLIFSPTLAFFYQYNQNKALPKPQLQALKLLEVYAYLFFLRGKKRHFPSKFQCVGNLESFLHSLPFSLTKGQTQAILAIQKDLASNTATKRLIMGDVGCGKTMVILASVVVAYPYKSLLMAPTTILAQQLFIEAQKYLPKEIRIGLFLGDYQSKKQEFTNFDFIIGTQALLFKEENLQDFALIMTDEQHRFGTKQRHQLETLATLEGKKPHILQFSATPIPRTLAMLNADLIDYSFIKDLPFKKEILTQVIHKQDFPSLLRHIQEQIKQDHQIIIVYPLVEESQVIEYQSLQEGQHFWLEHFENVYITNGKDKNKEQVLQDFRDKGSILLATTLVEVGISLPKLSTIVIVGAERMGLATLHQLRGRVSRNGIKGYCFLYTHQKSCDRLKKFSNTLNGFEIAELDLEYRKSGDLLRGERQSGEEFMFFNLQEDVSILQKAKELLKDNTNLIN